MPAVAARALDADDGLIGEVMDVRAFTRAWQARAAYEASDPRPSHEPEMSKRMRDRLVQARFARLSALKREMP